MNKITISVRRRGDLVFLILYKDLATVRKLLRLARIETVIVLNPSCLAAPVKVPPVSTESMTLITINANILIHAQIEYVCAL